MNKAILVAIALAEGSTLGGCAILEHDPAPVAEQTVPAPAHVRASEPWRTYVVICAGIANTNGSPPNDCDVDFSECWDPADPTGPRVTCDRLRIAQGGTP